MAKFTKPGNWYIDSLQGTPFANGGTGTKENPFKYLSDLNSAATAVDHKVILSGYFSDNLAVTKLDLHFEGEGVAIIDGYNAANNTFCLPSRTRTVKNITFQFFQGGSVAINSQGATGGSYLWEDCRFYYSNIWHGSRLNMSRCVFFETVFNGGGASSGNSIPMIEYCTFVSCRGNLSAMAAGLLVSFVVRNNIFHLCSQLSLTTTVVNNALTVSRPANSEFNYNIITPAATFCFYTNDQWKAYGEGGYQGAGRADTALTLFNDYDAGRDDLTFYMNDFSMKWDCGARDASKDGIEIGARRRAFYLSADSLWNNYRDAGLTTNLTYSASRGIIMLNTELGEGTFRSLAIPLPATFVFDRLNMGVQFVYVLGLVKQFIDNTPDLANNTATNQRTAFDIGLAFSLTNNFAAPVFTKVDINNALLYDSAGRGPADDNYDIATAGRVQGGYVMLEFKLRSVA